LNMLPPLVAQYYANFYICPHCHKIYWEGTQFKSMKKKVDQWKKEIGP
jgi:uncharacterized protein with PIN domain